MGRSVRWKVEPDEPGIYIHAQDVVRWLHDVALASDWDDESIVVVARWLDRTAIRFSDFAQVVLMDVQEFGRAVQAAEQGEPLSEQ